MRTIGLGRLSASALVGLLLTAAPALAQPYSIRFFGTGTNDIDRIKIRIDDPARPVDVAGDFTIEFWMKATGGTTSACQTGSFNWVYGNIIIDRDIFGSGDFGDYGISMRGGRIAFGVGSASQDQTICSSTAVNDGAWHHVAVTRASATGQMRIYIDGTQRASGTGPTGDISYRNGRSTNAPDDPFLVFGAEKHDAGGSFPSYNGLLDEVRVSRVVRYSSNFTRPAAPFTTDGNTVGLYHLDDGPGAQTAIDTSGASGGPSHGVVRYGSGGQANRPSWSTDVPFGGSPPPPPSCTYTLSSSGTNVGAGIVNGSVNVTAPGGCGWTATSNVGWLTITTSLPKSGSGTLTFRTTANPSSTARTGTLTIAGKTFTVTQAGAGCTFSLSLSGANIGAGVVNGSVNVTAPGGCGWTATTNAPSWLTITGGLPGSGSGALSYRAAANPASTPRTGTLTIAGKTFTVTQAGAGCTFSLSSSGANIGAGVVNGSVNVTAPGGCGWTATTNAPSWLTITGGLPGSGSGSLTYRAAANPNSTPRTGTLTIAGKTFTVTQAGAGCTFSLSSSGANIGAGVVNGSVNVTAPGGCGWTATTNAPSWLTITGGLPGSGSGSLTYRAAANPNSTPRTGTLTIAGKTFTVTQAGAGCTFTLSAAGANIGAGLVNGSVNVTAPGGCGWTATTNAPSWLTITSSLPKSGSGTLGYRALANPTSTPRTGTLTIAGKTFTVTQAGAGCTFTLSASSASVGSGIVNGSVNVTAPGGCGWTATSHAGWLTITSSLPKSGSGTLTFRTTANPNSTARTGTLTIAGKTFTVTQAGASCTITLTPASAAFGSAGGTGVLNIGTAAGCVWSAETRAPNWLQILSATSGSGPSPLTYRVLPNTTGKPRDSTLRVSGVRFRVVQSAGSCAISVSPAASSFASPGGSGMFNVTATAGCAWTAVPGASWLAIDSGSSGTGPGIVEFTVAPKTTTGSRSASVSVSGSAHTVTQQGVSASTTDSDGDGLPDDWETRFGLNPDSASGQNGASGDPDNDGLTNDEEFAAGTHPRGAFRRYLAEGATGSFFGMRIALANPGPADASVVVRFQPRAGSPVSHFVSLPAESRATVNPESLTGLGAAELATVIESNVRVVVDRTMWWDGTGYGAHAETALPAPALQWYLAEGATHSGFRLFYLLQNPSPTQDAVVEVTYVRPDGPAVVLTYPVARESRFNIDVNSVSGLPPSDVSAIVKVLSGPPIVVERAMYRDAPGRPFLAGHEAAGVTAPALRWYFAEGATGSFFDTFCLLMNPTGNDAEVRIRYLLPDGAAIDRTLTVAAMRRQTVWVDTVAPELASTATSIVVESTNGVPVVAERAMWWPLDSGQWTEAHATAGATTTASRWGLAEGEIGGSSARRTFLLVANTGPAPTTVRVTLLLEGGGTRIADVPIAAHARQTVDVAATFGALPAARFGAVVESLDGAPLSVERAMYWNAGGEVWAAGTSALGVPLP